MRGSIYKFPVGKFGHGQTFTIEMPIVEKFLDVQMQNEVAQLWAVVDADGEVDPPRLYCFRWFWTGDKINGNWRYVGTVQDGEMVRHLFTERD